MEPTPDWSDLFPELLVDICKHVLKTKRADDFRAFRGACSSWRAAAKHLEESVNLWPEFPFLMLSEKKGRGHERRLYSLSRNEVCTWKLPIPGGKDRRCIGSRFGWLLTQECSPGEEKEKVDLLNPFTGARIPLPDHETLPGFDYDHGTIKRSVLSADPSVTSDYVLVVISDMFLQYWKPGDEDWTRYISGKRLRHIDVNYCNRDQTFYSVGMMLPRMKAGIWVWDFSGAGEPGQLLFQFETPNVGCDTDMYVVESSRGELLVVLQHSIKRRRPDDYFSKYCDSKFYVYQVNVEKPGMDMVTSVEDAIFVGSNAAFCFVPPPDDVIISSHSIYFAGTQDVRPGIGAHIGVYGLKDRRIRRFPRHVETFSFTSPPFWVLAPSFLPANKLV